MLTVATAKLLFIAGNVAMIGFSLVWALATRWAGFLRLAFAVVLLELGVYVYAFHVEPNWLQVRHVEIDDAALAKICRGLTIVQISDLHVDEVGRRERQLPDMVNQLHPDMVLITGDFISSIVGVKGVKALVSQLKAPMGVWGVLGNTDHIFVDGDALTKELEAAGMQILTNEAQYVRTEGGGFYLVGVDDPVMGHDRLERAWVDVPVGMPSILLAHGPDIITKPLARRASLVLAGHTHGGQLGVPIVRQLSDYADRSPYMAGRFHVDDTQLYVNQGIGMKTRMFRFLCRPEITVFQFRAPVRLPVKRAIR